MTDFSIEYELLKIVHQAGPILSQGYVTPAQARDPEINSKPHIIRSGDDIPDRAPHISLPTKRIEQATIVPKPVSTNTSTISLPNIPALAELSTKSGNEAIEAISHLIKQCQRCELCKTRHKPVPGAGYAHPIIMVIGESPGTDEDQLGLPFVGAAGQFLDKWLDAIGVSRYRNAFITDSIKCRPPQNREPLSEEIANCRPYLDAQISVLKPRAILILGHIAASVLAGKEVSINQIRGQVFEYAGIPWMSTYHPSAVLRDPELKRPVWEDLKVFKTQLVGNISVDTNNGSN